MLRNRSYANLKGDVLGASAKSPAEFEVKLLDLAKLVRTAQECQQQSEVLRGLQDQRLVSRLQAVQDQLQQLQNVIFTEESPATSRATASPRSASQIPPDAAPRSARALTLALGGASTAGGGGVSGGGARHGCSGASEKAAVGGVAGRRLLLARVSEVQALEARVQALESELRSARQDADQAEEAREQLEMLILERLIALESRTPSPAEVTPTHSSTPGGGRSEHQTQPHQQRGHPHQNPVSVRDTQATGRVRRSNPHGEDPPRRPVPSEGLLGRCGEDCNGVEELEEEQQDEDENDPRVLRLRIDALTEKLESSLIRLELAIAKHGGWDDDAKRALRHTLSMETEGGRPRTAPPLSLSSSMSPSLGASGLRAAGLVLQQEGCGGGGGGGGRAVGAQRAVRYDHEGRRHDVADNCRRSGEGEREGNGLLIAGVTPRSVAWADVRLVGDGDEREALGGSPGPGPPRSLSPGPSSSPSKGLSRGQHGTPPGGWGAPLRTAQLDDSASRPASSPPVAATQRSSPGAALEERPPEWSRLLHQRSVHLLQDLGLAQQALSTCVDRLEGLCPRLGRVLQELDNSCCAAAGVTTASIAPTCHTTTTPKSCVEADRVQVATARDAAGGGGGGVYDGSCPLGEGRERREPHVLGGREPHVAEAYSLAREAGGLLAGLRDALTQVIAHGRRSLLSAQDWKPQDATAPDASRASHTTQPTAVTGAYLSTVAGTGQTLARALSSTPTAPSPRDVETLTNSQPLPTAPPCFTHVPLTPSASHAAASGIASAATDSAPVSIISLAQLAAPQTAPHPVMMPAAVAHPSLHPPQTATVPNIPLPAPTHNGHPVVTSASVPRLALSLSVPSLPTVFPEWLLKAAAAALASAASLGPSLPQGTDMNTAVMGELLRTAISDQQPYSSHNVWKDSATHAAVTAALGPAALPVVVDSVPGHPVVMQQGPSANTSYTQQPAAVPLHALFNNTPQLNNTTKMVTGTDRLQSGHVASPSRLGQHNEEPIGSARQRVLSQPANSPGTGIDLNSIPVTFSTAAHTSRGAGAAAVTGSPSLPQPSAPTASDSVVVNRGISATTALPHAKATRGILTAAFSPPRRHTTGSVAEATLPSAAPMRPPLSAATGSPGPSSSGLAASRAGTSRTGGSGCTRGNPVPLLLDEVLLSSPPPLSYDSQRSPLGTARHVTQQGHQVGSPVTIGAAGSSRRGRSRLAEGRDGDGGRKLRSPIQSSNLGAQCRRRGRDGYGGYGYEADHHADDDDSKWGWLSDEVDTDCGGGGGGAMNFAAVRARAAAVGTRRSRRCTAPGAAMLPVRSEKPAVKQRTSNAALMDAAGLHVQRLRRQPGGGGASKTIMEAPSPLRGPGAGVPLHQALATPRHASQMAGTAGGRGLHSSSSALGGAVAATTTAAAVAAARPGSRLAAGKQDRHASAHAYPPPVPSRRHTVSTAPVVAEVEVRRSRSRSRGRLRVARSHKVSVETFGSLGGDIVMPASTYIGDDDEEADANMAGLPARAAHGLFYSSSSPDSPSRCGRKAAAVKKTMASLPAVAHNRSWEHLISDLEPSSKKLPVRPLRKPAL